MVAAVKHRSSMTNPSLLPTDHCFVTSYFQENTMTLKMSRQIAQERQTTGLDTSFEGISAAMSSLTAKKSPLRLCQAYRPRSLPPWTDRNDRRCWTKWRSCRLRWCKTFATTSNACRRSAKGIAFISRLCPLKCRLTCKQACRSSALHAHLSRGHSPLP